MNKLIRYIENTKYSSDDIRGLAGWVLDHPDIVPHAQEPAELVQIGALADAAKESLVTGDSLNGLSTGYPSLDKMTRGLAKSEITVLFGDTGHGKSQLAQNITVNLAKQGKPVLFIGLEMTNTENTARFLQMIDSDSIYNLPIMYPANTDIGYKDIENLVKTAVDEKAELVVIDHLHALPMPDLGNRADSIEAVMYEIRRVVINYNIPLLLISHISRRPGENGPPELRHLKSSGAIEQVASVALSVWLDPEEDNPPLKIIQRKNRNRGRRGWHTELAVQGNVKLVEANPLQSIFPGAKMV